jgi:hypothetical protein
MVEHANITQHLLDSFNRPDMEREMLNADLDMIEPIHRPLTLGRPGESNITLLRVVEIVGNMGLGYPQYHASS